ncbi:Aminobenzoyl-glutamate transport protein [Enterobacter asburiae]|uniref:Aminobenzoyl-glutamate transport protein n=1 Tax=Enterobacter asburiae TaxID=61645 RepID=A0A376F9W3_ENTAS|nr:Aminobenzoyl-glutamate transport protein [Enterobacter asburiae]
MASSVIVLTIVGGLITDKIIEPRLGKWEGRSDEKLDTLSKEQRFGLRVAGVVSLAFIALVALMVVPENGILRDPVKHTVLAVAVYSGHRAADYPLLLCRFARLRYRDRQNPPSGRSAAADDRADEGDGGLYRDGVPAGAVCGDV